MQHELQVLVRCTAIAGFGGLACYLIGLAPIDGRIIRALSLGVVFITLAIMLRSGGAF